VVEHLARMYPNAPKVALGFSQVCAMHDHVG
jgi:hypothetical protein